MTDSGGSRWQSADAIDVGDVESEKLGASGNLQDHSDVDETLHSSKFGGKLVSRRRTKKQNSKLFYMRGR